MLIIKVKDIASMALTEDAGKALREQIGNELSKNKDKIQIDFEGINIFTTMFFNASIGYFILNYGPQIMENIELLNLSSLGNETFEHSYLNAKIIFENKQDVTEIGKITNKNLGEL